jgi:sugar lactone lactonase YvrE
MFYVADTGNNRVLEYNPPIAADGVPGAGDRIADEVFGQSDSFATKLCNLGAPAGVTSKFGLCGPQGVAVDSMGNLYVADSKNNRVLEYNFPSLNTVASRVFGQVGDFTSASVNKFGLSASSLFGPSGIALDSADNLWVADANNNRALEYNTPLTNTIANKVVGQLAFNTNAAGTTQRTLSKPVSVALDSGNNLYVADQNNSRILEYNNVVAASGALAARVFGQGGSFTTKTINFGGVSVNGLFAPSAVALDGANNLYVKDGLNNRVLKYNGPLSNQLPDLVLGQPDFTHDAANEVDGGAFLGPNGVAIDTSVSPPRIWVADTLNNRVLGYNNAAAFINGAQANVVLGQKDFTGVNESGGGATPATGFDEPYGVAVDKLGHLYVLDSAHDRVLGYKLPITVNGQAPKMVFGEPDFATASCNYTGTRDNKGMCFPQGIAVDPSGNLFVGDTSNDRVLEYNAPFSSGNDNLPDHVFGPPDFVSDGCAFPPTASSICSPTGVASDAAGNIYIADTGDNRVVEFNTPVASLNFVADKVFGQPNFVSNSGGVSASLLNNPTGVAVDSLAEVYVVDNGNHRVLGYKTQLATGNVATLVFGQFGSFTSNMPNFGGVPSPYTLDNPQGAAVDPSNNLYVADQGNNRVLGYNAPFATTTPVPQPMTVTSAQLEFQQGQQGHHQHRPDAGSKEHRDCGDLLQRGQPQRRQRQRFLAKQQLYRQPPSGSDLHHHREVRTHGAGRKCGKRHAQDLEQRGRLTEVGTTERNLGVGSDGDAVEPGLWNGNQGHHQCVENRYGDQLPDRRDFARHLIYRNQCGRLHQSRRRHLRHYSGHYQLHHPGGIQTHRNGSPFGDAGGDHFVRSNQPAQRDPDRKRFIARRLRRRRF